jgi:tryptophan synthase alpha subunit
VQLLLDSLRQNGRGFGAASAEQVRQIWRFADAAVVGSAVVNEIQTLRDSPDLVKRIGDFVRSLVTPAD